MGRGFKLFSYQGIPVYIHWSFGLILFYILYIAYSSNLDFQGTSWLTITFLTFFGCVILHEFGHALMARRFGISTKDIVLTPIGGVARLLRMPKRPIQEFYVAIAGPAVNIGIAVVLILLLFNSIPDLVNRYDPIDINRLNFKEFLFIILVGNVFLALFNLLPAFPMDGGRILRALLATKLSRKNATKWASWVGRVFALGFIAYGVYVSNYILVFIGIFVFMSAGMEYRRLKVEERLQSQSIGDIFDTQIDKVFAHQLISDIDLIKDKDFLVFNRFQQLVGILAPDAISEVVKKNPNISVENLMQPLIIPVRKEDSAQKALYLMQTNSVYTLPVYDNGDLIGVIRFQDIIRGKP